MTRMVKLADLKAWLTRLNGLDTEEPGSANVSEAGNLLTYLHQYGVQAEAILPGVDVDRPNPLEHTKSADLFPVRFNPDLDWTNGEIDLDVPRAETDLPPDRLIDQITELTNIRESQ